MWVDKLTMNMNDKYLTKKCNSQLTWILRITENIIPGYTESGVHMSVIYNDEGLEVYSCQICGKGFKKSSHVKTHIENVHTADGKVKCGICTKTFKNKDSLTTHFRIIHELAKDQIY